MKEINEKDIAWSKGFEAGVAFTLAYGAAPANISNFIMNLEQLRRWKTYEEWRELVEKNIVEDNYG